ncbi:hypothetical protein [Desulfobacter curvatus]
MSFFIGSLACEETGVNLLNQACDFILTQAVIPGY